MADIAKRRPIDWLIGAVAVGMSYYHLDIAYTGGYEPMSQRALSYMFGVTLIFLIGISEDRGWRTWASGIFLLLALLSVGYPVFFTDYFLDRLLYVDPIFPIDYVLGISAILVSLEATRRTINITLPLISLFFLAYTFFGPYFPWELAHKGASFTLIIDHQYMTYDGLWTTPLSVFSVYIFLFILFGAFLERMGASEFYVQLSMAVAGRLRGGPAKAAIFASAMTGTIMGSTNANVVTTGTFTIPMMKRAGFRPEIAAGIETAASTGGQIMPPVMGASAFLIVEFTGISYWEIVKVSILPAVLYFFSVYMIVHFEARKGGLKGLPSDMLPSVWPVMKKGGFFLLPPAVIFAYLMLGRSVPYAGIFGILTVVLLAFLKGAWELIEKARTEGVSLGEVAGSVANGVWNIVMAMERGAKQTLPICAAVATVGIIIGALYQTGLGLKFSSLVVSMSQGSLFLGIWLVGIASFILGMGLPTSAAYIVLSVMAVPAMLELGEPIGLTVLAAHLIVFWYSLDSCFTPPVCVPAYTAAGLAGANPAKAAWAAFRTAKGMYVIPLMFAYTPLLLIGTKPLPALEAFASALLGFTALSASMVGHMYFPFSIRGRLLLGAGALLLFWPGMAYHLAGAAVLGGVFLMQRKRLLAEGEPDINPAVAPLETA
ncbi:MAG TPA: permease [Nitrospinae bacterium]|nr:permease [Nitrospinota bacterium]